MFDIKIPFVFVTGDIGVGKTLFALNLNPDDKSTAIIDLEHGSSTYADQRTDITYINALEEVGEKYGEDWKLPQLWLWFELKLLKLAKSGKYKLLIVDPASEIEDALEAHVRSNLQKYGLTERQMLKSPALIWGVIKSIWKRTLARANASIDTVSAIAHMRHKFVGNTPTPEKEARGKSILRELASIFVELKRKPGAPKNCPPAAIVHKGRLSRFADTGKGMKEPVAVLPDRMPKADAYHLRWYIANPVGLRDAAKDEVPDQESEKKELATIELMAQTQRADAARIEAETFERQAKLERARKRKRAERLGLDKSTTDENMEADPPPKKKVETPISDAVGEAIDKMSAPPAIKKTDPPGMRDPNAKCNELAQTTLKHLKSLALNDGMSKESWKGTLAKRGAKVIADLTENQAEEIIRILSTKLGTDDWQKYIELRSKAGAAVPVSYDDPIPF